METIAIEKFECDELTVPCTVPIYWNDLELWNDGEEFIETTALRGIFSSPYLKIDLGEAGQDSSDPVLKLLTAEVPGAREGDAVTVDGVVYKVGTPRPDNRGVTELDLVLSDDIAASVTVSVELADDVQMGFSRFLNDAPAYCLVGTPTLYIRFSGSQWLMVLDGSGYTNPSTSTEVPATGWVHSSGADLGEITVG